MRIIKISADKGDSLAAIAFNSEVCKSNVKELEAEWDKMKDTVVARLARLGPVGNAKPDADFDVNPYYKIRQGDLFSRFIDVCVISEKGAYLDFLKAVYSVLKKSEKKYRICIRPEIVGWGGLFYVFLEVDQAQVWCRDKAYGNWLMARLKSLPG